MFEQEEYYDEIRSIERYFTNTHTGSILFAICNDEKLLANINTQIEFVLNGKRKHIAIHSFKQGDADTPPIQRIRDTLAKQKNTNGIIFIDAEAELFNNDYLFTQINFARELLLEFNIPMLFWMNERTIQLFRQQAIDFYNQRALADVYFTSHSPEVESDRLFEEYKAVQISLNNPNLKQHEARLKLLQKQLHQAEEAGLPKESVAKDIVIELIKIYAQMPGMAKSVERLIKNYLPFFDAENPSSNFTLGYAYSYLNEFQNTETYYGKALKQYKKLAETNPQAYLPNVANTLNNLAILHSDKNELTIAENEYAEALEIRRKLAETNPQAYLPGVANTLNNLAVLHKNKNELAIAENEYAEALEISRKLAETNPQAYLPGVANTLNNLANLHSNKNELAIAENEYAEALEISRKLAETNPQAYLPDVAQTLNNLAILHSNKNELAIAENEYAEALEISRKLAETNPQAYLPDVAQTLNNLAVLHWTKNELAIAENEYAGALEIRRELAETNPKVFLPDVAQTLNNLAILHSGKNELIIAEYEYAEALEIWKKLAEANPQAYLIYLANTLKNFSAFYQNNVINKDQSLKYVTEALTILQKFQHLHQAKNYLKQAFQILKDWQIDPATFLKENNINITIEE